MLTNLQPSLDIELRYIGEKGEIDMGVFAPCEMLDITQAETIIEDFLTYWQ